MNEKQREYSFKKLEEFELESKKLNKKVIESCFYLGISALAFTLIGYKHISNLQAGYIIDKLSIGGTTAFLTVPVIIGLKDLIQSISKKSGIDTLKAQLDLDLALDELKDKEILEGDYLNNEIKH